MKRTVTVLLAVLLCAVIAGCTAGEPEPTAEIAPLVSPSPVPTPVPTPVPPPEELLRAVEDSGYRMDDIPGAQFIVAECSNTDAVLTLYEKAGGVWTECGGPISGKTGKNGVSADKVEGDLKTPAGLFTLGPAFGILDAPETGLSYRQADENNYWVDDPASSLYNTWTELTDGRGWSSAEHLIDYSPQYNYSVVINYNMSPTVPDAGSAIFLHCGSNATAGCIAIGQEDMLSVLAWLDETAAPSILIYSAAVS